ncbi:MAG: tetratricopeptide repeat protein [Ferruginibacter sp.]
MINRISSLTNRIMITGLLLFLFSCQDMATEADAIKKNQEGVNHMNEGKYELALTEFNEAINNPGLTLISKGTIYRNIALTYHELNKLDSSIHFSTLAAKCYKKNSYDYLVNMANVDILTGKGTVALVKLLKAAAMDPDDLSVNNTLGLIYLGDYGEEFADPEKALIYNKKAFEVSNSRITEDILGRNYYALAKYELAEMHYERIHEQYPDVLIYALNTGMIKYKLKKTQEADLLFDQLIARDSSYRATIEVFKDNNR